jgi:hypothetical protein
MVLCVLKDTRELVVKMWTKVMMDRSAEHDRRKSRKTTEGCRMKEDFFCVCLNTDKFILIFTLMFTSGTIHRGT